MYFLEHKKQHLQTDSKRNYNEQINKLYNDEHSSLHPFKEKPPDRLTTKSYKDDLDDRLYGNIDGHQIMSDGKYVATTEISNQILTHTNIAKQVNILSMIFYFFNDESIFFS